MALAENQITLEVVKDGTDGADGKSAYESAQDGGYSGTEAQFNSNLAEVPKTIAHFYFDENGAHVLSGDYRTDVKDGLQIVRNADSVPLASFEDKLVKIGEDSKDAEVQLCGGAGGIKYDKTNHRLQIANNIEGNESIRLETNFDAGGYDDPYAWLTMYKGITPATRNKVAQWNMEASTGDDGKEVYISANNACTPDDAPEFLTIKNLLTLHARDVEIGSRDWENSTVKMYGNVTVDDFKVLTEGDIGYTVTRIGGTNYTTDLSSGTNTIKDVATISLPPGLWLVMINSRFTPTNSGTHITSMALTENSESAAVHDRRYGSTTYYNQHNFTTLVDLRDKSGSTTMYLTGQSTLAGSWNRKSSAQLSIKAIQMGL